MTSADLHALRDEHAFDPAPSLEELYHYHVPFDELVGETGCEGPLRRALFRGEQVALVGDSGSGKSSVIGHVLGPLVEGVAPIPVPVAVEGPEVAGDPVLFSGHLVRTIARHVEHAMPRDAGEAQQAVERSTPTVGERTVRHRFGGAIGWLRAKVQLAKELESVNEAHPRSSAEIFDQAKRMLRLIEQYELRPVLVFDDTDKWFGTTVEDPDRYLEGFFGRVVRLIAEELGVAAVLAVHHAYLEHSAYAKAAGFVETTIRVPRLPNAESLGRLLERRASGRKVFEPDALERLFAYYHQGSESDLRQRVLLIVHTALAQACDEEASRVNRSHIELAIAEYGEPVGRWRRFLGR